MKFKIIFWDWRDQIDIEQLNEALAEFTKPRVADVETHDDNYVMVVCEEENINQAQAIYEGWIEERRKEVENED